MSDFTLLVCPNEGCANLLEMMWVKPTQQTIMGTKVHDIFGWSVWCSKCEGGTSLEFVLKSLQERFE